MKVEHNQSLETVALRPPATVMRLARMGSFHQSRLSFMRVLLRRLRNENWQVDRPIFDLDEKGVGVATYRISNGVRNYTLVAFAHELADELRSDRVIAEAWDATFTLFDGEPTEEDIERLSRNVPLQEAGRISGKEFCLSRANKSVRLFAHVLERLSNGQQPDRKEIDKVGYLMRTTAVYGSGKFGAADRTVWAERNEFSGSFQPELLSVWLIRTFAADWVEHLAAVKGGSRAVKLDPALKRRLGIGNSTGLGMAPFLINHPSLIHAWIYARETAIARVCNVERASAEKADQFVDLLRKAKANALSWHSEHPLQIEKINELNKDIERLIDHVNSGALEAAQPWNALCVWSETALSLEGQELLASLILEPYPELVDELSSSMNADEVSQFRIDGSQTVAQLSALIADLYHWCDELDFTRDSANSRVWYTSEEKLEPRLGDRFSEPIEAYEQPLAPARDVKRLQAELTVWDGNETIAAFLMAHPEHRQIVRRVQVIAAAPYGEIHDNTIDEAMLPIDLLRCKLSFFGATKFDPRSDRWVRITMYQNAPYPDELADIDPDQSVYPSITHA